jgi:diguanylate cyclase (GGDEF)-like protein
LIDVNEVATCPTCGGSGVVTPAAAPVDEQTVSDRDQTASDADQTWSDHDQSGSDRDQLSADEDQRAADRDYAAGGDAVAHDQTASAREHTRQDREDVSRVRDETAGSRSESAEERDRMAGLRDRAADARDRAGYLEDMGSDADASAEEILLRAERYRVRAAADRASAAQDRLRATADRNEAARERVEAFEAQAEARHSLVLAATDELTGAWTRKVGLINVSHEIERSTRTGSSLVLAFIDVDGLKEVNDSEGHASGDELLRLVAETVRANVRSYDVIVRYGGDEFLCAMPNLTRVAAQDRMARISAALAAAEKHHSIGFGLAEHKPGEGLDDLVGRADADLLKTRRSHKGRA